MENFNQWVASEDSKQKTNSKKKKTQHTIKEFKKKRPFHEDREKSKKKTSKMLITGKWMGE